MTAQTIINTLIVVLSIIFFIIGMICLWLNDVQMTKPLEDKYRKLHKKYFIPSSRILVWTFTICTFGLLIFDHKQTLMVWEVRLFSLVLAIFFFLFDIFVIAKYSLLHKYTKRRF